MDLATITVYRFPFFVQCKLLALAEATVTKLRLASRGIASVPPPRHQHPRCFHCVPCQQLTEDNPHTPPPTPHTHTRTISGVTELGATMTIHLGSALVFAHQSILTCPQFLEEVGHTHTHTHTHYHAVSEKNSSLLPCNVTIIIQNEKPRKLQSL